MEVADESGTSSVVRDEESPLADPSFPAASDPTVSDNSAQVEKESSAADSSPAPAAESAPMFDGTIEGPTEVSMGDAADPESSRAHSPTGVLGTTDVEDESIEEPEYSVTTIAPNITRITAEYDSVYQVEPKREIHNVKVRDLGTDDDLDFSQITTVEHLTKSFLDERGLPVKEMVVHTGDDSKYYKRYLAVLLAVVVCSRHSICTPQAFCTKSAWLLKTQTSGMVPF